MEPMSNENQIEIPPAFMALFLDPGRSKPNASREEITRRYELCDDMANLLTEHARNIQFSLNVLEEAVLLRCHQGLLCEPAVVTPAEADWVIHRLAELLAWPQPQLPQPPHPG